ncbi:MAG TPA: hypothetical protein VI750_12330 [Pyrinomonadaceae bacterium]|nr:hypothetical protein [Pyrinomonadaceae bacterium]
MTIEKVATAISRWLEKKINAALAKDTIQQALAADSPVSGLYL